MKLYWSSRSPYVRKVMVTAHECDLAGQIECESIVVSAFTLNPDILTANPLGKIPALVLDDGSALFDSRVICEYLDTLHHGEPLFPAPGPERMQALRWQAYGDGMLDMLLALLYEQRARAAEQRSANLIDSLQAKLTASLDALEEMADRLQQSRFGIGQIAIGCALAYMDFRFADHNWRSGRSALSDWHAGFSARASVIATAHVDA